MTTTLYVNYTEKHISGGKALSEGRWASRSDAFMEFNVIDITLKRKTAYHETFEMDLSNPLPNGLFVLVARYHDGNTFGRTYGYGSIEGVFTTHEEAQQRAKELESGTVASVHGYLRWKGYFSGLDGFDIEYAPLK